MAGGTAGPLDLQSTTASFLGRTPGSTMKYSAHGSRHAMRSSREPRAAYGPLAGLLRSRGTPPLPLGSLDPRRAPGGRALKAGVARRAGSHTAGRRWRGPLVVATVFRDMGQLTPLREGGAVVALLRLRRLRGCSEGPWSFALESLQALAATLVAPTKSRDTVARSPSHQPWPQESHGTAPDLVEFMHRLRGWWSVGSCGDGATGGSVYGVRGLCAPSSPASFSSAGDRRADRGVLTLGP